MVDTILRAAFRIAPEPYAERISLLISQRRVERRWRETERAAIQRGASVVTIANDAGSSSFIVEA